VEAARRLCGGTKDVITLFLPGSIRESPKNSMTSGFVSCFSMKVRKDSSSSMPMCTDESALSFYTATRWT
jgi:hypothetical protein